MDIKVFRILQDITGNVPGAKNLAAFMCQAEWMFQSYLDYVLPAESIEWFLKTSLDPKKVYWPFIYTFQNKPIERHLTCMFIHSGTFWEAGGYDEDFAGAYGYDDTVFLAVQLRDIPKIEMKDVKIYSYKDADLKGKVKKHELTGKNIILNSAKDPIFGGISKTSYRHLRFDWKPIYRSLRNG